MKKNIKWSDKSAVNSALSRLGNKRRLFDRRGRELLKACDGNIFPADMYFIATCNRALQIFDAFGLTMKADYYSTSVILLRVQLDSLLRCFGLLQTANVHAVAHQVLHGTNLSKIKDKHNQQMSDGYLVKLFSELSASNQVISHMYKLSSGYVHLSDAAIHHVMTKAMPISGSTQVGIYVGSTEPDVPVFAKLQLVQAFEKVTEALIGLFQDWASNRGSFGNVEDLKKEYGPKS